MMKYATSKMEKKFPVRLLGAGERIAQDEDYRVTTEEHFGNVSILVHWF